MNRLLLLLVLWEARASQPVQRFPAVPLDKSHSTRPGHGYNRRCRSGHRSAPPLVLGAEQSAELRPAGLLPLPIPVRGGSIDQLAPLLNLRDRDSFVLVVAWMLGALRSAGPFPLLAVSGEQGSAKTVLCKFLRALIDPNSAPVRALPRDNRELFIAAHNSHVLAFDNLSAVPSSLSDTLCRLASGGAFAAPALYSNQDEVLFSAARPVVFNGITDVIERPDLADRAIVLTLGHLSAAHHRA